MQKDISTQYTRYLNKQCGRKGYYMFKKENAKMGPKEYGGFVNIKKSRKNLSI